MPHDHSVFDLTAPAQPRTGSGILAEMKAAGRSLVARTKRGAAAKVLSAMLVAAAAITVPQLAQGQATVYSNYDYGIGVPEQSRSINANGEAVGQSNNVAATFSHGVTTQLPTGSASLAYGVNDSGEVVGKFGSPYPHGFFYNNGTVTDLGVPCPTGMNCSTDTSAAYSINNSGQIPVYSSAAGHLWLYSGGTTSDLGSYGNNTLVIPYGINDSGQITGDFRNSAGNVHAFLYSGGTFTDIGTLGGTTSVANAINGSGQVVGYATTASGAQHAFLYSGGVMTDLGTVSGTSSSSATGINDSGLIVGQSGSGFTAVPFVYSNGTMTNINNYSPRTIFNNALAINASGLITASDSSQAFYTLTPAQAGLVKTLGDPADLSCACDTNPSNPAPVTKVSDPITVGTGNMFEQVTDYTTVGQNPLAYVRYYNSQGTNFNNPFGSPHGVNWTSNFDAYLVLAPAGGPTSTVLAVRPDGQVLTFTLSGSTWTSDTDVDYTLTNSGTTWTLKNHNDTVETYNNATYSTTHAQLSSIELRNGYTQTLNYQPTYGYLQSVSDSYGRTLTFGYNSGYTLRETLTPPDGPTLTYNYGTAGNSNLLTSVSYSTSPVTSTTYLYEDTKLPFALTGVLDENSSRFSTWSYDDVTGRAISSQQGGSLAANLTTVSYDDTTGNRTVTNAFGVADTYKFSTLQGVPKATEIDRAATSTTAAATRTFGYDTNGFLNSETDWNGNQTTYINNAQGNPTTINYAVGSPVAYSVTISYDPTFIRLPYQIVAPGLTSTFAYDGSGNPLSRTDLDTTTNSIPYSTNGQQRVTQWTWSSTGEMQSVQLPRTDVTAKTSFMYYPDGSLEQITDALSHQTNITHHTGGGRPTTIVDPNNVTTTLTYDGRLNLHTSTVQTGAGNLTTTWNYDPANNLQSVQQPDNSKLTFGYDAAHRLTSITDLFNNTTTYTLDALGDKTLIQVKNPSATVTEQHSGNFDALGRVLQDIGGVNQTTTYTYDNMGNTLTIAPPSPSGTIRQTFDALNRLSTHVDPSPGGTTTITYDSFNRVLSAKDALGNKTSYVYDGFGDRTQTTSPDSMTTVYHFDPDRNLTQKLDARSNTANYTYDALDRNLTVRYPADSTLNVSRTYDQTGHGFGIGRLTSATDQPGSISMTYDERGNVTQESRTVTGAGTLNTSYAFDAGNNISSITYPSGTLVQYARDIMGRVTSLTAQPPGAGSPSNVATGITYEPFGPITGLTFGNGITGTYGYDLDYRPTTRVDAGTATVQNLTYGYFANNSVQTITDAVNAANTQNMTYDALDRLTAATSGAGGYGSYSWTWDANSNIKTQVINGTTTTFSLWTGSNKLHQWVTGSTTVTVSDVNTGNIYKLTVGGVTQETLTYNKADQMASSQTTSSSASYKYGLDGQRLEKSIPGSYPILYQYGQAAKELLSENDLHGGQTADYIYLNGRPIAEVNPTNAGLYFMHTDRLGTVNTVTDGSKAVVWAALYNPFGDNPIAGVSGTLATQSLRLPGQYMDPETGYNHNGFRDYAGTLTRYVETDPIGLAGGMNTYQYVRGNPFKLTDKKGLDFGTAKEEFEGPVEHTYDVLTGIIEGWTATTRPYPNQFIWPFSEENIAQTTYDLKSLYNSLFPKPCPTQQQMQQAAQKALTNGQSAFGFRLPGPTDLLQHSENPTGSPVQPEVYPDPYAGYRKPPVLKK
jgi:RHS repeat-associated protein